MPTTSISNAPLSLRLKLVSISAAFAIGVVAHYILLRIALVYLWLEYNNALARKVCTLHTAYQFLGLAREHRSAYHFYSTLAMLFAH